MSCEDRTGSLLATLAASKPDGHFLELGTGVGAGAAWPASGMPPGARLVTVEANTVVQAIACHHLADDARIEFVHAVADDWLTPRRTACSTSRTSTAGPGSTSGCPIS
ncbi:O-methyltransferase [Streptomyces sp. NPDC004435]|uniref:O-methyltransferase n=1 Tax=Streptomyces sp. NPDC004435 TaxID=3364701 RepID=UPI00367C5D29